MKFQMKYKFNYTTNSISGDNKQIIYKNKINLFDLLLKMNPIKEKFN